MRKTARDGIVTEARERVEDAWQQDRENREAAFLDLKMIAGDQWPATVRQERQTAGRPVLTINRLPQFVHQVANDIRRNPPGIKVTPTGEGRSLELAKIYTGIIRDIEFRSDAASIYAQAGGHAVACGIGHFRIKTGYAHDMTFEQEISIERIPFPLSVLWDPNSVQPDRSDAGWCVVTELMHKTAFKAKYPDVMPDSFGVPMSSTDPEAGLFWANGDFVRIGEYWRKKPVRRTIVELASGEIVDVSDLTRNEVAYLQPVRDRVVDASAVESVLMTANEMLTDLTPWAGKYLPIIPVVGGEMPLDTKIMRYGLIRFARDPQQLYNLARSSAAESIAQAPRAPYLATPDMIGPFKSLWDTHNVTNRPYLLYKPDPNAPGGRPIRESSPEVPAAFIQEAQIASDDMKATTGIYDASLGARSNETSGIAIRARESQGDAATAHFSGNLNVSLIHAGRVLVDLIPRIYDTPRIQRILHEDDTEEFVPLNHPIMSDRGDTILLNDLSQGRYDVRLRTGPSYATQRLEAADSMLQFVQAFPAAAALIGDLIAKNMDWPGADKIAERLKRAIPANILGLDGDKDNPEAQQAAAQAAQQAAQMQAMQEMMGKLEAMLKAASIEKTRADARKSDAAAQAQQLDTLLKAFMAQAPLPPDGFAEDEAAGAQLLGAGIGQSGGGATPLPEDADGFEPDGGGALSAGSLSRSVLPQGAPQFALRG